jgi:hypothetical protein
MPSLIQQVLSKQQEIEHYLEEASRLLPPASPDIGLGPLLEAILNDPSPKGRNLRASLGFPEDSSALFTFVSANGPASERPRAEAAQRINESLWRFEFTLEYIDADWARAAHARCRQLRTILEPYLAASKPSLAQVVRALNKSDASQFAESGPDATVYAVLRAFPHTHSDVEDILIDSDRQKALDYLLKRLEDSIRSGVPFDDVSNAWWAVRTGICNRDTRFVALLPDFLTAFSDPQVPTRDKVNRAYVPESYVVARIASYMLSNAEAIVESNPNTNDETWQRLRTVIEDMATRLIDTPLRRHLYVASVHHEGLRNYRDYVDFLAKQTSAFRNKPAVLLPPAPTAESSQQTKDLSPDNPPKLPAPGGAGGGNDLVGRLSIFSKFGLAGVAIGVFYELVSLLLQGHSLSEAQNSTALLLIYGISVIGLLIGAFQTTKDRGLAWMVTVVGVAIAGLAVGAPAWAARSHGSTADNSVYTVRVTVVGPSGKPVDGPHVWSSLGGEVKSSNGTAEIVIPPLLVGANATLTVYAEDPKSLATGSSDVLLDSVYVKPLTVKLTAHPDETVRGMVVDSGGAAVANASVSVVGYGNESVQTNEYGGFELQAHKSSGTVAVHAEKPSVGIADEPAYVIGSGPKVLTLSKRRDRTERTIVAPPPLRVERTGDPVIDRVLERLALLNRQTGPAPEDQIAAALAPLFERPAFSAGMRQEDWTHFLYILCRTASIVEEYTDRFRSNPDGRNKLALANQKMTSLEQKIGKLYGPTFSVTDHVARYLKSRDQFIGTLTVMEQPTAEFFAGIDRDIQEIRSIVREAGLPISK